MINFYKKILELVTNINKYKTILFGLFYSDAMKLIPILIAKKYNLNYQINGNTVLIASMIQLKSITEDSKIMGQSIQIYFLYI